jgi:hypothetical protein
MVAQRAGDAWGMAKRARLLARRWSYDDVQPLRPVRFLTAVTAFLAVVVVPAQIDPFEFDGAFRANTNAILDHQFGQLFPINEDYLLRDSLGVLHGSARERTGRHKDALRCSLTN